MELRGFFMLVVGSVVLFIVLLSLGFLQALEENRIDAKTTISGENMAIYVQNVYTKYRRKRDKNSDVVNVDDSKAF